MSEKIKVVWLCHFSNAFVHEKLNLQHSRLLGFVKRLVHKPVSTDVPEFANWITNGIHEFESIEDVELHIVSPYPWLKEKNQEFKTNGVYYHFFKNEDNTFITCVYKQIICPSYFSYSRNRNKIRKIIASIKPDIIHLFGAENPYYGLGFLDLPDNVITIAQLQTLINDPDFKDNYPISNREYNYRARVEQQIIKKADYLGTRALKFRKIILKDIKPNAVILNTGLALNDSVVKENCEKKFDFVYFSLDLSKAADLAIEAFALAFKVKPNITLDIIGGCGNGYKQYLDGLIQKYGIANAVTFEGRLPTHDDVIKQIRKSRFALLPLKIDLTSGTIREAMSSGLPVVTTDTGELGTQKLNNKRKNVLISPIGNHQALANNMVLLLENTVLANTLRQNSFETRSEARSNEMTAHRYVEVYMACIECYLSQKALPTEFMDI